MTRWLSEPLLRIAASMIAKMAQHSHHRGNRIRNDIKVRENQCRS